MRPFVLRRRWLMQTQFGRRIPLIIGGIWQSAWLFVVTTAGTAKDPTTDQTIGNRTYVRPDLKRSH